MVPAGASATGKEYGIGVLKGAIGAVPWVGTLLNEALFDARSRLKQQRLNDFFIGVAEDVKKLSEDAIDHDFLQSDEFSDLIEDICNRVARTRNAEKRYQFQRVLVGAMTGANDPDFSSMFLAVLGEITEAELRILRGFARHLERKAAYAAKGEKLDMGAIDYGSNPWGFPPEVARQIIQSLIAKGLLFDDSHGRYDSDPFTVIMPTDLGGRFLAWLDGAGTTP